MGTGPERARFHLFFPIELPQEKHQALQEDPGRKSEGGQKRRNQESENRPENNQEKNFVDHNQNFRLSVRCPSLRRRSA